MSVVRKRSPGRNWAAETVSAARYEYRFERHSPGNEIENEEGPLPRNDVDGPYRRPKSCHGGTQVPSKWVGVAGRGKPYYVLHGRPVIGFDGVIQYVCG